MKKGDLIFSRDKNPCIFLEEISFENLNDKDSCIFLKVYDIKKKFKDILDIDLEIRSYNWWYIPRCQKLSEYFIREFQDKVHWFWMARKQNLSKSFREEFKDKLR